MTSKIEWCDKVSSISTNPSKEDPVQKALNNLSEQDLRSLDGKLVRVITDIFDDGKIIVDNGQTFVWDESTTDQNIDGVLVFVDRDEVELVDE